MAGLAKNYVVNDIFQSMGSLWVIATPPTAAAVRLTLAPDGSPDSVTHGVCQCLGIVATSLATEVKPKIAGITADQYDAPVDAYETEMSATISGELAQFDGVKLATLLGVGNYYSGAFEEVTFGGGLIVPTLCLAVISPSRVLPSQFVVSLLYYGAMTGGWEISMGRSKPGFYKFKLEGMYNPSAATPYPAGGELGVIYRTLSGVFTGTPQAQPPLRNDPTEIFQGPADCWLLATPPTDAAVTAGGIVLDGSNTTGWVPDSATYGATSLHLGLVNGASTMSVMPKIGFMKADQFDAPVAAFVEELEAKIEVELEQTSALLLANALGLAVPGYSPNPSVPPGYSAAAAYEQLTFGGANQPNEFCVALIGVQRTSGEAVFCCLFKVYASGGVSITVSRKKPNYYKVTFTGISDTTRTPGQQIGMFWETTPAV